MGVFQTVFDVAQTISINKKGVVAQTTSRDQTIRAVNIERKTGIINGKIFIFYPKNTHQI